MYVLYCCTLPPIWVKFGWSFFEFRQNRNSGKGGYLSVFTLYPVLCTFLVRHASQDTHTDAVEQRTVS